MKDSIKNRKKKLLALCLSAMMFSSVAALAACSDSSSDSSSSSSSSSTVEEKDTGLIKNAGFETFDEKNAINTSVTGWARSSSSATSGSGLSSKAASGVIDLSEEAWQKLTGTGYTMKNAADAEEAEQHWEEMTIKERLAFYDAWKEANKNKKIADELKSFYVSYNIDSGDIPTFERFETYNASADDTKVLMIHNENPEPNATGSKTIGTGQKYTSSSTVTVKAGTSAKFSVWVKTLDLKSSSTNGSSQDAVDKGAYISVNHTVGSTTLDPFKVENINTEAMGVTENNGWKNYTFLLKGSSYTDSTFTVELGLGQGGGTYRGDYVNGYAFFDAIECETITNAEFEGEIKAEDGSDNYDGTLITFKHEGDEKIVDVAVAEKAAYDRFALDFYGDGSDESITATNMAFNDVAATADEKTGYTSLAGSNVAPWLDGFDGSKDITAVTKIAATANAEDPISLVHANYFAEDEKFADEDVLLLLSTKGAAYTAKSAYDGFAVNADGYRAISFFVKTSVMNGKTGAGVTLEATDKATGEVLTTSTFSSIDTTTLETTEIDDKDINDGWIQYFFFIENDADMDIDVKLSFHFGPTTVEQSIGKSSYEKGFAAFTGFESFTLTKKQFASAKSGSFANVVTVTNPDADEDKTESGFDTAKATPANALENGLANLQNYTGIYSNSAYITGRGEANKDSYPYAGLVSKKNFEEYYSTKLTSGKTEDKWVAELATDGETITDPSVFWNKYFGADTSLPLFIWNDGSEAQKANAYGFISKSKTIAANTYTAISVRVKGNTNAYVRLVDTSEPTNNGAYNTTMSIDANRTYWYDNNGNIWTGDSSEKSTRIAFYLQTNGLYKANKGCDEVYKALTEAGKQDKYFANLSAYEKDSENNLIVAEGGASHDYNDLWNGEGKNGIAFYYENGVYYADKAKTIPVEDLSAIDTEILKPRTNTQSARYLEANLSAEYLCMQDWTYVTFYVHTGDTAKNYRLEVWNGNGTTGADGKTTITPNDHGYVVFDTFSEGTAETNFTKYMADEEYTDGAVDSFKSVFSYFDTASYLRYNASLDEKNTGNLYKDNYTATAQTEGFAYLKNIIFRTDNDKHTDYTVFADYQYSEKTVVASAADTDDDTDDNDSTGDSDSETNPWLLASSLAIAGVLVLAIGSIVIRKIVVKAKKNRAHTAPKQKKSKK